MNPKNRKINTKPSVKRPKPKRLPMTPKKSRRPNPKKFRSVQIRKGVKQPRTKTMQRISNTKTSSVIKNEILKERKNQKQNIVKLNQKITKLRNLPISMSGLEELRESSINRIQNNRLDLSSEIKEISAKLVSSAKRLSKLERKFRKLKSQ